MGRARLKVQNNSKTARPAKHAANATHVGIGGAYRGKPNGGAKTRVIVDKVTIAVATFFPSSGVDVGDTVHVDWGGAPVQVQVTV